MIINDGYLIVMFDLPSITPLDRKAYSSFKSKLHRLGFLIVQESVYYRYLRELKDTTAIIDRIKIAVQNASKVMAIKMTKQQFKSIIPVSGKRLSGNENSIETF